MNLGLETDVNNPNFAGAVQNPDGLLHVEFFMHTPLDQHKSRAAGKRVYQTKYVPDGEKVTIQMPSGITAEHQPMKDTGEVLNIPYIRIQRPGDNTSIIERAVLEEDKARWPNQWLYFAHNEGLIDQGVEFPGYKIEDWPHINQDSETIRNLKYQRFFTVEQIAGASDSQVQRLGMGGQGLRKAAQEAIRARVSDGINKEMAEKDAQIAALRKADEEKEERLKRLEAILAAPQSPQASAESVQVPATVKRGGRPKGSKNKPKELIG